MTPDIIYDESPDAERWYSNTLPEAAGNALDVYAYSLRIPWKPALFYNREWTPSEGLVLTVAQGRTEKLTYREIAPHIKDDLLDRAYDEVGEAYDCINLPEDLQEQFIEWLGITCGELTCYRVEDIETIDVVWRDGDWHLPGAR